MSDSLLANIMEASSEAIIGTGLIFLYFVIMVGAILYRVKKGDHVKHH